jgi:CBS domain-containing protein
MGAEDAEEEPEARAAKDRRAVLNGDIFKLPVSALPLAPAATLDVGATVGEAVDVMQRNNFGSVLVTKRGKLAGIVTERDILNKVVGKMERFQARPVAHVMTPDPLRLRPEDMIAHVMNSMHVGGYRHVPIVNEKDQPVSVVSIKDVMSFILDYFPEDVVNTVAEPYRGPAQREGA